MRVVALCGRVSSKLFFDRPRNAKTDTNEWMCRTSFKSLAFLFRKIITTYERTDVQNLDISAVIPGRLELKRPPGVLTGGEAE